ncbi:hypothetical protein AVHY2522_23565 [Acidovorax sp. SUPP2522]|uniref:hypothetical protein n=1 Tax=unclassified Acidovorax TaxID=2684926 RepID=UPI00234B1E80|nr:MULTISPECIES: hypothetical protein [unclassified Acidovorax]WCM96702.1 hypothetical protein M5C96_20095 [Acidovorax sp. GBBC 1281]GKT19736.1 hypothetical protein AVHY2522_23565 [Acidovorax sp. SUPP2522]
MDSLKTRLENTKNQLQANHLQNLTGEQISGNLITAVIWSWFAAAESHSRLSQNQAGMVEPRACPTACSMPWPSRPTAGVW